MDNYGLTERSEQEEWVKLGPLAEPTPADKKNRGAADRRRGRRDGGREARKREEVSNARERQNGNDEQERREEDEDSEMEDMRRAMAKAIREIEREEEETGQGPKGEEKGGYVGPTRSQEDVVGTRPQTYNNVGGEREGLVTAAEAPGRRQNNNQQLEANANHQFPTTKAEAAGGGRWSTQTQMRMMKIATRGSKSQEIRYRG